MALNAELQSVPIERSDSQCESLSTASTYSPRTPSPIDHDAERGYFPSKNASLDNIFARDTATALEWPDISPPTNEKLSSPDLDPPNPELDLTQYFRGRTLQKDERDSDDKASNGIHYAKRISIQRLSVYSSPPSQFEFELDSSAETSPQPTSTNDSCDSEWEPPRSKPSPDLVESQQHEHDDSTSSLPPTPPPKSKLRLAIPRVRGPPLARGPRIGRGPLAQRGSSPLSGPRPPCSDLPLHVIPDSADSAPPPVPQRSALRDEQWLMGSKAGNMQFRNLQPFSRPTYITTESFTSAEFRKWLPLIKHAMPGRWYTMPTAEIIEDLEMNYSSNPLLPIMKPWPDEEDVPRIRIGTALQWQSAGLEASNNVAATDASRHDSPPSSAASSTKSYSSSIEGEATFYSVVSSVQKWGPDVTQDDESTYSTSEDNLSEDISLPKGRHPDKHERIYQVVCHGSHAAAASQAYYDAGVKGWSTLFTCAIDAGAEGGKVVEGSMPLRNLTGRQWLRVQRLSQFGMYSMGGRVPVLF